MENIYFKSVEVVGNTKEEIFGNSVFNDVPAKMWTNATPAYKKWCESQTCAITDSSVKQFMLDYLSKKKIGVGSAAFIVVNAPVKDTRERPYTRINIKKTGSTKHGKVFSIVDKKTGEIYGSVCDTIVKDNIKRVTKAEADNLAKKLYSDGVIKSDIDIVESKKVISGDGIVCSYKYTPSKNSHPGVYQMFGFIKKED